MTNRDTPIVHQRRLRTELKALREHAKLTQKDVSDHLEWSVSKIIRIENGTSNVGITDLRALLMFYGLDDKSKIDELLDMARASRKSAWWTPYRSRIDPQFYGFLAYEASAVYIRQFQSLVIPGLLQTPEYIRAIGKAFGSEDDTVERGVDIRMKRQELVSADGPTMVFVLDEAVLRRRVGGTAAMKGQLQRIKEAAKLSNVTIRIIPFDMGGHRGMQGSFAILDLSDHGDEQIIVLEEPHRDVLIRDDQDEARKYFESFAQLEEMALPQAESVDLVDLLLGELPH